MCSNKRSHQEWLGRCVPCVEHISPYSCCLNNFALCSFHLLLFLSLFSNPVVFGHFVVVHTFGATSTRTFSNYALFISSQAYERINAYLTVRQDAWLLCLSCLCLHFHSKTATTATQRQKKWCCTAYCLASMIFFVILFRLLYFFLFFKDMHREHFLVCAMRASCVLIAMHFLCFNEFIYLLSSKLIAFRLLLLVLLLLPLLPLMLLLLMLLALKQQLLWLLIQQLLLLLLLLFFT